MAARTPRPEGARGHRPALSVRGQGRDRLRAGAVQARGRRAGPGRARRGRRAAGPDPGLRRGAGAVADLLRTARRHLRPRRPARHPRRRAADLPPPAWAGAALSPGAPDRRAEPRHRTRHQGHPDPAVLPAVQHPAHVLRDRTGLRGAVAHVRRLAGAGHRRHGHAVHRLHAAGHRMASQVPPPDERDRLRGQHQGHRKPAELRDGQVLRQRGARGAALRRLAQPLRARRRAQPGQPVDPEHRPGRHHFRGP